MTTITTANRNSSWPRVAALCLIFLYQCSAYHETLEVPKEYRDNFEEKAVAYVPAPTDMEFTPDGKYLFVTSKFGKIWRLPVSEMDDKSIDAEDVEVEEVFEIPHRMCTNGARGLGGIAIHPEYPSKPYIYVFHNHDKYGDCSSSMDLDEGPINRMSRYTLNSDLKSIDEESELVMFETRRLNTQTHNSGYIAFGKDGNLYVTVGEAGTKKAKSTDGTPYPMAFDVTLGCVLRLTDDGGIPPDNPFSPENDKNSVRCNKDGQSGNHKKRCQEVYACGLRNPFRFAVDPNADGTRFFINDVGDATWERVLEGGDGHAGAQYGYPEREGPCVKTTDKDNFDCEPQDWLDYPVHWYKHNAEDGGAITGGAFVPRDAGWPSSFDEAYIYAEYAWGGLRVMYPNKNAECKWNDCKIPKSPWDVEIFSDEKKVVGMLFGPHKDGQSLYFINHFPGGKSGEAIFRMSFTGESNRDPKSRISADRTVGFVPFTVQFDGTSSYDPDVGDSLTYEWDLDGDGEVDSTDASPEYTYMVAGSFEVTLRVGDGRGGKSSRTSIRIDVDNSPPLPKIESIAPGTTFAVGDIFTLTGTAWDAEDGFLPDSALTWEVRQMHNNHYHPFLDPTSGNNIVISEAPSPEDFFYLTTTTSYLSVHLTATDSQGLSATTIVDIQPRLVNLVFETEPSGLPLLINQDKYETPVSIVGWEGDRFEIEAASLLSQEDGEKLKFVSWSDGGSENVREFVVPSESDPEPIVASFEREVPEEAIYDPEEHDGDGDEDLALSPIPIGDKNDEPKKSTKFVVGLLDMSVSVRFTNDIARRRRLAGDSNVDLVTLLEDELKTSVSDAVSSAVALAINFPGSDYAPLHGIRFARKGENALTDSDGLLYTSTFGGLAIFDRDDDLQSVPDAFAMQSAQVKALDAVEDELKSDLREFISEAGGIALGYQHVRSVSAEVIGKASVGPSTTSSSNDEKDPILTGLLVIAILLVLAVAAGGLGYYYMCRRSGKKPRKVRRDDIPPHDVERNEGEENKTTQHDKSSCGSETDDETPANSPTKAAYRYDPADPYGYSSGAKNSYTHGNDDESVDGASVNTSAAGSVASSIQQITRDMISQLNSVLGGPDDDDDDDDAIQNGEEETNANASLASVFGRKLD